MAVPLHSQAYGNFRGETALWMGDPFSLCAYEIGIRAGRDLDLWPMSGHDIGHNLAVSFRQGKPIPADAGADASALLPKPARMPRGKPPTHVREEVF
ncbi:hypothetical protein [Methylobacterium sp. sgz302541]|uniref:hypothetical protein n=1 Tax=unclassified Methylobacterium TaxID=2615210 RepID=UPI003D33A7B0